MEHAKVVEAYVHNSDRVTLVYKNNGSFTFIISEHVANICFKILGSDVNFVQNVRIKEKCYIQA